MAYKYEEPLTKKFNEEYRAGRIPNLDLFNELKEVYAKAKAWDNYLAEVERDIRNISDNEDEIKWHVDYVINEYMEDE
ncbi:hypothetical protein MTW76_01600 [Mammaliicoccus sciuri]|uniref:hypothetical protein n=1 Tax=Mammaliicoccus sciuri TaxID=1296 RepID=UPI001FB55A2A|nr:hypothetical protein [Mammaliicoccus sciuri]MCJ0933666.1 hypothetical protein [Mammaliicoccus sciuri]